MSLRVLALANQLVHQETLHTLLYLAIYLAYLGCNVHTYFWALEFSMRAAILLRLK